MEFKSKNINELLGILANQLPLSDEFEKSLAECVELEIVRAKRELSILTEDVQHAWFSVDCWVAEYRTLDGGKEEVYAIYGPNQIFTDITSFLKETPSKHKFMIISGSRLLRIDRSNFESMRKFRETTAILEHYMILQWELDRWHSELMTCSDYQKVERYAQKYPINELPAKISASYLRMTPSRFSGSRLKFNVNR